MEADIPPWGASWKYHGSTMNAPCFHRSTLAVPWKCIHHQGSRMKAPTKDAWRFNGASHGVIMHSWCSHGAFRGVSMGPSWYSLGDPMGTFVEAWCSHGSSLGLQRDKDRLPSGCKRFQGTSLVVPWCFHGPPMMLPRRLDDGVCTSMVLPWHSHRASINSASAVLPCCIHGAPAGIHEVSIVRTPVERPWFLPCE